jgi:hypothetical protein
LVYATHPALSKGLLEDVLGLGRDFDDQLKNLEEVFVRFRAHNLKLKPKKCSLFRKKANDTRLS